jgi:hypothetical protein
VLEERLDALQMGITAKIKMGRKVRNKSKILSDLGLSLMRRTRR